MTQEQTIPALRFSEFKDDWKLTKLGSLCSSHDYGMNASAVPFDGKHQYIRITDIDEELHTFKPRPLTSPEPPVTEHYRLKEGDIVFARTGASTGKTYLYNQNDGNLYFAGFLIRFSLVRGCPKFVYYQTFRHSYFNWVSVTSMRSGQPGINANEYASYSFYAPTKLTEQDKIANFLGAVDEKTAQLQKKKDLLEDYKKGCMQKLFSQEIRFTDDNGNPFPDWEEKVLGDILTIGSGRDYKHLCEGDIPVYGTGGYMTSVSEYLYKGKSVCIGRKGTINKPSFVNGEFWTVDTLFYTHSFKNCIPEFVFAVFQQINWLQYNEASGVPSLSKSTIEQIKTNIPSVEEQEKIADFTFTLDSKISLVSDELEKVKTFKKGLLQQMFV